MREWDKNSEQVSKIRSDMEKARSLMQVIALREKNIGMMNPEEFTTLIVESYYDIIKELITAIMSIDGWKTISHELLIGYLAEFYKDFSPAEIHTIDQLRKTRNDISYRGVTVRQEYLSRSRPFILQVINKLKQIVSKKML